MKQKSLTKSILKLLAITAGIILLLCIALAGYFMNQTPVDPHKDHSLGNGLEYLGSTQSGCVTFCDSRSSFSYYYGTDMTPEEVVAYFGKADLENSEDLEDTTSPIIFSLNSPKTNNPIYVYYYTNGKEHAQKFHLPSNKKHVIVIQDEDYQTAKDSL